MNIYACNYITFLYRNVLCGYEALFKLFYVLIFLVYLFFGGEEVDYVINSNYDGINIFFFLTGFEIEPCKYNEFYNHKSFFLNMWLCCIYLFKYLNCKVLLHCIFELHLYYADLASFYCTIYFYCNKLMKIITENNDNHKQT